VSVEDRYGTVVDDGQYTVALGAEGATGSQGTGYGFATTAGGTFLDPRDTLTTSDGTASFWFGDGTAGDRPTVVASDSSFQCGGVTCTAGTAGAPGVVAGLTLSVTAPTGTVGLAYTASPSVGGGRAPYTWSLTTGQLPAGLRLDTDTGVISGTPSASGTSDVTLRVVDAAGWVATAPLSLRVVPGATPAGGYWEVAGDGGIFAFGRAHFFGSTGGMHLNAPVVGLAATPDDGGYWEVAADGGIFAFGDARYFGSMGGFRINAPVVGLSATADGGGYWLVGSDGGVYAFGDARFLGSTAASQARVPVVGLVAPPAGTGYWVFGSTGTVFGFGGLGTFGSLSGTRLNAPVVGAV
jgi:hypothetical protein